MGGVEGEFGDDFSCFPGADDGFVVVDEADDLDSGVGSADAEVEHASGVTEADFPVVVDGVVAASPSFSHRRCSLCASDFETR